MWKTPAADDVDESTTPIDALTATVDGSRDGSHVRRDAPQGVTRFAGRP